MEVELGGTLASSTRICLCRKGAQSMPSLGMGIDMLQGQKRQAALGTSRPNLFSVGWLPTHVTDDEHQQGICTETSVELELDGALPIS